MLVLGLVLKESLRTIFVSLALALQVKSLLTSLVKAGLQSGSIVSINNGKH